MVTLTKEEASLLMDLVEEKFKPNYKTQEEWQASEEFGLIEKLDTFLFIQLLFVIYVKDLYH